MPAERTIGGNSFKSDYPFVNALRMVLGLDPIKSTEKAEDRPETLDGMPVVYMNHSTRVERVAFYKGGVA